MKGGDREGWRKHTSRGGELLSSAQADGVENHARQGEARVPVITAATLLREGCADAIHAAICGRCVALVLWERAPAAATTLGRRGLKKKETRGGLKSACDSLP